ncbi:MAG: PAS domain S-box protein [Chitinophagales bacterium]
MEQREANYPFLSGGGEMGERTRQKDWSKHSLGIPSSWPHNLRLTLGILLNSGFPMFLFWGKDHICFYNDAYRPSLGNNGKHPDILGAKAEQAWPEIWDTIEPLITSVITTGKPTWSEDQLIPIYRNGHIEEVYWTFSYSAVNNQEGVAEGVLVTCYETTEKVKSSAELRERDEQLQFAIDAAELATWDLNPQTNRFSCNQRLKKWLGLNDGNDYDLTEALQRIAPYDQPRVVMAMSLALDPKGDGKFDLEYSVVNPSTGKEKRLVASGRAVFADGKAVRFSGTIQDVSNSMFTKQMLEKSEKQFRNIIRQAPQGIAVFRGPEFIAETANANYLLLIDKKEEEFIGKPLFETLPLVRPAIENILNEVYHSGVPYTANEFPAVLNRYGRVEEGYFNFIYHPLREDDGTISGIIVVAIDVSANVFAKRTLIESENAFRTMVMNSPIPMAVFIGNNYIIEMANDVMVKEIWQRPRAAVIGKPLLEIFPELLKQKFPDLLKKVLETHQPHRESEAVAQIVNEQEIREMFLDFEYAPFYAGNGNVTGVVVTVNDVTEKVLARKKLEESEKQFRQLADSLPAMVWETDLNGKQLFASKRWKEFTGLEPSDADSFEKMIHPQDRDQVWKTWTDAMTTGAVYSTELRLKHKDGDYQWFMANGEPIKNEKGEILKWAGAFVNINEQKKSEHELKTAFRKLEQNEERLNVVIDASELGVWEWTFKNDKVVHSLRYSSIFGHPNVPNLEHSQMLSQIHPEDMAIRNAAISEALTTGVLHYEARIYWPDKSLHWIEARGKVFFDGDQQAQHMIGTIRDITEEKNHQQELEESEQKFRLLADSMPQYIWTATPDGKLNYFNRSVYTFSGFSEKDMEEKGWLEIVHPDDREENLKTWEAAIRSGNDFLFEHRFRRHDGSYRWQLSRAIPQRDANGNIQMWVGTSTDIEEHKTFANELERQVEERTRQLQNINTELAKSEERYHLMVGEVQDYAIIFLNRNGIVENWNKGAQRIKGYKAEDIIGRSFENFYSKEDRENGLPNKILERALATGRAAQEGWRVRNDGTLFWASTVLTALHDESGQVIGFSKVTRDLTRIKEAQDKIQLHAGQLELKNKELEKKNAELQSFAYVSSHDLQEPLRKIQTFASRILDRESATMTENGKDYFRRMQDAANRMQTLIQDLLAYSRTNSAERKFERRQLSEIIDEVKSDLQVALTEKNGVVHLQDNIEVNVISFQFRQLFQNLIGNSLKFSRPGIVPVITITAELKRGSDLKIEGLSPKKVYSHICISDNGIGFEMQYRDRIFEVFQRLHGRDEYSGTGIGLAIVKRIVDNHHGIINASGESGEGAQFDIYIPAAPSHKEQPL